jgi:hypothetical protein
MFTLVAAAALLGAGWHLFRSGLQRSQPALRRQQVDLPVPRGPKRTIPPAAGCRNRPASAIFAAEMEFSPPFLQWTRDVPPVLRREKRMHSGLKA